MVQMFLTKNAPRAYTTPSGSNITTQTPSLETFDPVGIDVMVL